MGFKDKKISPFPPPEPEVEVSAGAFTADTNALVRTPPLAEEAFVGATRVSSTSDFGTPASTDQSASTELP